MSDTSSATARTGRDAAAATETKYVYNEAKLGELMLYVALKCEEHQLFGAVKLNKILFYSDFYAYAKYGRPITGASYRKLALGPAPSRLVPVREMLQSEGAAFLRTVSTYSGMEQKRLLALRAPDLSLFSAEEIALVDSVIQELSRQTAQAVSDRSHEHVGWRLADMDEEIPYETILLPNTPIPLTDAELKRGKAIAAEL